jgi:hypothetical protein
VIQNTNQAMATAILLQEHDRVDAVNALAEGMNLMDAFVGHLEFSLRKANSVDLDRVNQITDMKRHRGVLLEMQRALGGLG